MLSFTQSERRIIVKIELTEALSAKSRIAAAVNTLRERVPRGWRVDAAVEPDTAEGRPDGIITVGAPDGTTADVVIEYRTRVDPADVGPALSQLGRWPKAQPMVMAPFLTLGARRVLRERGASWSDAAGNFRLALDRPALYIEVEGVAKNPFPRSDVPLKSLKGPGAAAAVRALCDYRPPYSLSQLRLQAGLANAGLFRVVDLLQREALVEKQSRRGPIVSVDWPGVLTRWCEDYSLIGSNRVLSAVEPRGTDVLLNKLRRTDQDYVLTALAVASRVAPVAPSRLIVVYAEVPEAAASDLGLTPVDAGANVLLVEPFSPALMRRSESRDGLRCAALSQVAADLLTSPGRGPAEAEALIAWMQENEVAWRETIST
jgi:hypothetical protein